MDVKRALLLGTLTCWVGSFVYIVAVLSVVNRGPMRPGGYLGPVLWPSILAGLFVVCAALVSLPALSVLQRTAAGRSRVLLALTGAVLSALAPLAAMIVLFHGPDDPQTLAGFVAYWQRVPGELIGLLPFCIGGAVLGGSWPCQAR